MDRMPAIFFGHGNPMNALTVNEYTQGWKQIGERVERPPRRKTIAFLFPFEAWTAAQFPCSLFRLDRVCADAQGFR
jgi:aromatic ring-opening dioxygenase catalytic subunit (LigB family)